LSFFIDSQGLVYEAHSTDYQSRDSLRNLVRDHFSILKVGPGLTYAYREAIFSLAMMENELIQLEERSNIVEVLDEVMLQYPDYWLKYYHGTPTEQAFKRKFSLSDRIRYYWNQPRAQNSVDKLKRNLSGINLPISLVSQYSPLEKNTLLEKNKSFTPENIIGERISQVLNDYLYACE
jgi:D-tagatose-1,6-bisphosphate aldolase subunit GatZ/KbaZ